MEKLATSVDQATTQAATTAEPGMIRKMYESVKANPGRSAGLAAAGLVGAYGAKKLYNRFNEKSASYKYAEENRRERTLGESIGRGAGYTGLGGAALAGGGTYYTLNKMHNVLKDHDMPDPVIKDFVAKHRGKAALGMALAAGLGGALTGGFGGAMGHAGSKLLSIGDREKKASKDNEDTVGSRIGSGLVSGALGTGAAGLGAGHYLSSKVDDISKAIFDMSREKVKSGQGAGKTIEALEADIKNVKPYLDKVKKYSKIGLGLGGLVAGGLAGGVGGGLVSLKEAISGKEKKASYDLPSGYLMKAAQEGFMEDTKRKLQENAPAILGGGAGAIVGGYGVNHLFDKGREANLKTQTDRINALRNATHSLSNAKTDADLVAKANDVASSVKRYGRSETLGKVLGNKYLKGGAIGLGALGGMLIGKESFKRQNDQGLQY